VKQGVLFLLTLIFALTISVAPALAGSETMKDCAKKCPMTACPMHQKADEAKKVEAVPHDANHNCDYKGKCEYVVLTVKGLSDSDSEAKMTKSLADEKGVVKVYAVDTKAGTASLCYDPDLVKQEDLVKAVGKLGFEATVTSVKSCKSMK
jgi:hypothetical protein